MSPVVDKPLRRDAERNRRRILAAAEELFARRGLGVTLNDIAHHAGVGVGTVYRRFPDRERLVESLFEQKVTQMVALMEAGIADPDPWHGLSGFLERSIELQSKDLALRDLIVDSPDELRRIRRVRAQLVPLGETLIQRAHDTGQLRPDIRATDLPIIGLMLSSLIDGARDVQPDLWRRYLQILLQGLSARPDPPGALAQPPLEPGEVDAMLAASKLQPR